jgi:hypothetical protein
MGAKGRSLAASAPGSWPGAAAGLPPQTFHPPKPPNGGDRIARLRGSGASQARMSDLLPSCRPVRGLIREEEGDIIRSASEPGAHAARLWPSAAWRLDSCWARGARRNPGLTPPGYGLPPLRGSIRAGLEVRVGTWGSRRQAIRLWRIAASRLDSCSARGARRNLGLTPPGYGLSPLRGSIRAGLGARAGTLGLTPPGYGLPPLRGWNCRRVRGLASSALGRCPAPRHIRHAVTAARRVHGSTDRDPGMSKDDA